MLEEFFGKDDDALATALASLGMNRVIWL